MATYDVKAHPALSGYELSGEGFLGLGRRLFGGLSVWLQEKRAYNEAYDELYALSDRELADIGIARSDIPAVAREAAVASRANA